MAKHRAHRTHSIAFKRQVVQEYLAGETLHGLARRHDLSRTLVRVWVDKYEAGAFDEDAEAADTIQEYEARIAALERLGTAIDTLGDARERKSLIETYDTSLGALEQRLFLDKRGSASGPVLATQATAGKLLEPAREAVNAEAERRRCEAAEREARAHEEAERREAEERRRKALAEAEAARAVLAKALPEAGEALAPAASGTA